jgi:hypothetical protein
VATKKQRRRRQKGKRHEYEYVWVDEEGRELDVEEVPEPNGDRPAAKPTGTARKTGKASTPARGIQPPSWRRVLKRAAIFVPLMFVAITVLPGGDELSTTGKIIVTAQWALILIPFMYLMELVSHRVWRRRMAKIEGTHGRKR